MFAGAHGAVDSLVIFAGDAGGGGDGRPGELTMLQVRHHPRVKIPGVGPYWKYIFQSVVQLNQQVLLSWPAPGWGLAGTLVVSGRHLYLLLLLLLLLLSVQLSQLLPPFEHLGEELHQLLVLLDLPILLPEVGVEGGTSPP